MDPEEVSGAKPFAESPAAVPLDHPADPPTPLDEGEATPPHGDPLRTDLAPPAEPEPAAEPAVPGSLDLGGFTPPHGDPLPVDAPEAVPAATPESEDVIPTEVAAAAVPAVEVVEGAPSASPDEALSQTDPASEPPAPPVLDAAAPHTASVADESAPVIIATPAFLTEGAPEEATEAPAAEPVFAEAAPDEASSDAAQPYAQPPAVPADMSHPPGDASEEALFAARSTVPDLGVATVPESLSFREVDPEAAVRTADELEAAALHHPTATAVDVAAAGPAEAPEERHEGSPNWMLAFICAWTGVTSLHEAWLLNQSGVLRTEAMGALGYLLLGIGLVAFAIEALGWGRPRRNVAAVLFPTLLTLAGVVCLVLWDGPARPL